MVGDLKTTKIWGKMRRSQNFARRAYCSLRNEMERNETKWKSAVCEIWNFGAVANVRTIEENYPLGRHSETHAKVVMKLFEAAFCFCWCGVGGVFMRQGDTHTFIAFYIMSFINWTTIFIVQIIIYFHLVSVLLHSCCITLISRSTCSFTDAGNSGQWFFGKFSGRSSL